jgi:zinc transport system ATP-binding protein
MPLKDASVIEVRDLWFSYNGTPVLKAVDLEIRQGDFLAVIGPNGGGKTTLLKLIIGILRPDRGTIRVFGRSPLEVTSRIGYVPQDIRVNKGFPISVEGIVLMGRMRGGGGWRRFSGEDRARARAALERVEMWDHRRRPIGELSGGQRQRVYVARALATDPELLFLDEPMSSVDTRGQSEFYSLLKELNERATIVLVSHDLNVLSSYTKSVACVSQQVFFHDKPEITKDMLQMAYHCPVELIAHGVPHRVLDTHSEE